MAQSVAEFVEVYVLEKVIESLGSHLGHELVGVGVFEKGVFFGKTVEDVEIFVFGQKIETLHPFDVTRIDDDVALVVDYRVELLRRQTQQIADLVGERAEIPDMSHGHNQLDMAHALAAHFLLGHLNSAAVADDALVADAFIFAAMTLIVFNGTKDALTEEAVAFRLVGTVVDGLGLEHFAARLLENLLGRSQADRNL